jgi:lysophospholipase L1-like esterase
MRRALGFMAVLLVVGLSVGCLTVPTPWAGDSGPYVGVIGDSLVQQSNTGGGIDGSDPDHYLQDDLTAAGYRVSLSAFIGATTKDLGAVLPFPAPGPEIVVIGLGTNDVRNADQTTIGNAIGNIANYLDRRPTACTALITIIDEPGWGLDVSAPLYNAALAQLAADRGNTIIADWAAVADAHPEYLGVDGVHHTPLGQAAYRSLIVSAVDQCSDLIAASATTTTT